MTSLDLHSATTQEVHHETPRPIGDVASMSTICYCLQHQRYELLQISNHGGHQKRSTFPHPILAISTHSLTPLHHLSSLAHLLSPCHTQPHPTSFAYAPLFISYPFPASSSFNQLHWSCMCMHACWSPVTQVACLSSSSFPCHLHEYKHTDSVCYIHMEPENGALYGNYEIEVKGPLLYICLWRLAVDIQWYVWLYANGDYTLPTSEKKASGDERRESNQMVKWAWAQTEA